VIRAQGVVVARPLARAPLELIRPPLVRRVGARQSQWSTRRLTSRHASLVDHEDPDAWM